MKLLCVFVLLWSTAVAAACPGDAGEPLPPREQLLALERELAGLESTCGNQAGYLAYRGAVLNALGRPQEAAPMLEQALLLDPGRAGAQLDYAEALAALGDAAAGAAFVRDLLARSDVPPALRPHLEARLNALEALQRYDVASGLREWVGTDWHGAASVTVKAGHDSNLNSAPSRDTLTLTLTGGEAVLLLADRFRARGGTAGIAEASGQLDRRLDGGGALRFFGEARVRQSPAASDTDYQQGQGVVAWSQPLASGDALVSLGVVRLRYGGDDLYDAVRLAVSRDWRMDQCRPRAGAEVEWRKYPIAPTLEGRFVGLTTGIACLVGENRITAALRAGEDTAQADRPGGDQRQADLRVAWLRSVGNASVLADVVVSHQRDATGYSPLLENDAARRLTRVNLHLEYAHPIARSWALLGSFDGTLQRSNLPLFDVSGRAVYFGVRWHTDR